MESEGETRGLFERVIGGVHVVLRGKGESN